MSVVIIGADKIMHTGNTSPSDSVKTMNVTQFNNDLLVEHDISQPTPNMRQKAEGMYGNRADTFLTATLDRIIYGKYFNVGI